MQAMPQMEASCTSFLIFYLFLFFFVFFLFYFISFLFIFFLFISFLQHAHSNGLRAQSLAMVAFVGFSVLD